MYEVGEFSKFNSPGKASQPHVGTKPDLLESTQIHLELHSGREIAVLAKFGQIYLCFIQVLDR